MAKVTREERQRIYEEAAERFEGMTNTWPAVFKGLMEAPEFRELCAIFDAIGWEREADRDEYEVSLPAPARSAAAALVRGIDTYIAESWDASAWESRDEWRDAIDQDLDRRAAITKLIGAQSR